MVVALRSRRRRAENRTGMRETKNVMVILLAATATGTEARVTTSKNTVVLNPAKVTPHRTISTCSTASERSPFEMTVSLQDQ